MVNLLPAEPVGDAVPMAEPMSQQEIAAHNIASGLQTGQISNPSALTQVQVADTALINIMPSTWRQPTRHEATGTLACALLTAICYFALNHHEVRKNVEFLPATCEPYSDAQLRPEIRPYRPAIPPLLAAMPRLLFIVDSRALFKEDGHALLYQRVRYAGVNVHCGVVRRPVVLRQGGVPTVHKAHDAVQQPTAWHPG